MYCDDQDPLGCARDRWLGFMLRSRDFGAYPLQHPRDRIAQRGQHVLHRGCVILGVLRSVDFRNGCHQGGIPIYFMSVSQVWVEMLDRAPQFAQPDKSFNALCLGWKCHIMNSSR